MSDDMARQQAESMARSIRERTDSGAPFGYKCPECGRRWLKEPEHECDCEADLEPADGWSYLGDALDIDYIIGRDGTYKGAEVLVGFGGPNVWIDTRARAVRVAWWSASIERSLPSEFIEGLDQACEELWEMNR